MGLFGSGASTEISPSVEAVFVSPPEHDKYRYKTARKIVARESDAIIQSTKTENLLLVAHCQSAMSDAAIVVTDRRSLMVRKGKIEKSLEHSEVAETTIGAMPAGTTLVAILSVASQQDYALNDARRFSEIIQAEVATPRIGNAICAHVDRIIGAL